MPPGSVDVVTESGGAITIEKGLEAAAPAASLTVSVKVAVPAAAGVPVIRPVNVPRPNPGGSAPALTVQASGEVPPLAAAVCE